MKAKVKETGKVIEVEKIIEYLEQPYALCEGDYEYYKDEVNQKSYNEDELDFINVYPDWQQVRIQASIAIMNANYTNPDLMQFLTTKEDFPFAELARVSVKSADILIEELKKTM